MADWSEEEMKAFCDHHGIKVPSEGMDSAELFRSLTQIAMLAASLVRRLEVFS